MSKTLILSDIHFSKPSSSASRTDMFAPLLNGVDTLILNGDTAETLSQKMSAHSIEMTEELISFANDSGVKVVLITGNHDPDISKTHFVYEFEKRVLVMHGHAVLDGVAPWSWRSKHLKELLRMYPAPKTLEEALELTTQVSQQVGSDAMESKKPSTFKLAILAVPAVFQILKSWYNFPSLTCKFLKQFAPETRVCITGHTHRKGIWIRNHVVIINTGCFGKLAFPSSPLGVVLDHKKGMVLVHRVQKKNDAFKLSKAIAEIAV